MTYNIDVEHLNLFVMLALLTELRNDKIPVEWEIIGRRNFFQFESQSEATAFKLKYL